MSILRTFLYVLGSLSFLALATSILILCVTFSAFPDWTAAILFPLTDGTY